MLHLGIKCTGLLILQAALDLEGLFFLRNEKKRSFTSCLKLLFRFLELVVSHNDLIIVPVHTYHVYRVRHPILVYCGEHKRLRSVFPSSLTLSGNTDIAHSLFIMV